MNFPDFNHFLQLRKDLWHWPSSRAALMVGAGMSLNAQPAPGTHTRFPTWRQLTKAMFDEIYPVSNDPAEKSKREERLNSTSPLRIASEYDAAFRPSRLSSFIRTHIPDTDHHPGPMHELLLQLPWRDVFTTNYDTLLERTEVAGRAYRPVSTTLDLTTAFSPRIIKLHGSFPSQTPFIITEEHYRTYPTLYAPFVNTVRQSLIENSLVLLGFSGDDPNFLEWTGWIRDELANHHSPIYLVGWFSLDNVQRSLLARRGVTPIDLAPLFALSTASDHPHASALKWFLSCLLSGRPQRPERWPEARVTLPKTDDEGPLCPIDGLSPPETPSTGSVGKLSDDTVAQLTKRWRFERLGYPGWLVPTHKIRTSLWLHTSIWADRLFGWMTKRSAADNIVVMRELNWRIETSMIPIFDDFRQPFEGAVDEFFPVMSDAACRKDIPAVLVSDSQKAIAWLELAFALLRHARENYDAKLWESLQARIDQIVVPYPQFNDRHYYEQALWRMWNVDRNGARAVLERWSPSSHSPLALMWKAGLLAELDELAESRSLLRVALRGVRQSLHNTSGQNIDLLSLEGWCTYLLFAVERVFAFPNSTPTGLWDEFSERWQELKEWDCDPWALKEYFEHVLSASPPIKKKQREVVRGFDPGHATVSHSFGGTVSVVTAWFPAFAHIRLYEHVGIPMRLRDLDISGDTLRNACKWTVSLTNFWSPALLIRAGKTDDLIKQHLMDRTQVATMDSSLATRLSKWAMDALKRGLHSRINAAATGNAWDSLVGALVEVLSRLTVRMDPSELQDAFDIAISLYRRPEVYSHVTLNRTCSKWFSRLFTAATDDQLAEWTPELLRFPLSAPRNRSITPWIDPMRNFPADRVDISRDAVSIVGTEIATSIDWLLRRARSESGEGHDRAITRLALACIAGLMSVENKESFGTLLWDGVGVTGVPEIPDFSYFNCLHLPHPDHIDVVLHTKEKLFSSAIERMVSSVSGKTSAPDEVSQVLVELALTSKPVVDLLGDASGMIEWDSDETEMLWRKAIEWWEERKRDFSIEFDIGTNPIVPIIRMLGLFMQRLVPAMDLSNDDEWNRVWAILSGTRNKGVYLTEVLPYVLIRRNAEREMVLRTISGDLYSHDEARVDAGARAIRHWIHLADADFVEGPPSDIIDDLIYRVVFRRVESIKPSMTQLSYLLFEKADTFRVDQINLLVSSLPAWADAVQLPLPEGGFDGFPEEDRPELRVCLGELASVLSRWLKRRTPDEPEPDAIARLRELYASDNLPEVRRAFDRWMRFDEKIVPQGQ